jgi:hypothetical protein
MIGQSSINTFIDRLFYDPKGQILVSALIGLSLSLMFKRVCKDNCILFYAPHIEDITNKVFNLEDTCYKYTPYNVKCGNAKDIYKEYNINVEPDNLIKEKTFISKIMEN